MNRRVSLVRGEEKDGQEDKAKLVIRANSIEVVRLALRVRACGWEEEACLILHVHECGLYFSNRSLPH